MTRKHNKKKTIFVLGCSRSGTSVVAGVLHNLGIHMGDTLRKPDKRFNPKGFFEDIYLMKLNTEIVTKAGGSAWGLPRSEAELKQAFNERIEDVRKMVKERNKHDMWGGKGVFTTLTKFWEKEVCNPHFIFVFRNPIETLLSMLRLGREYKTMDLINLITGTNKYLLDLFYEYSAIETETHVFGVTYEKIIADPERYVDGVIEEFDLEVSTKRRQDAIDFIIPGGS